VRRQPREKQNGAPPKRARGNDDVILQAAGISSFCRECAAVPGQIASQHFSYYASARVFIFAAVKGAGMRFSVYLRWHNNPVGIGMQDNFCCRGKKRPTAHGADDHRAATAGFGKKAASENLLLFYTRLLV